jgi:predicted 3-demethylubiquinone-9 3-methyltransferase (glyoxalase superfamily)
MQKITPFLWFQNNNALEAAKFYCSIFKNSKILEDGGMVVTFQLDGQQIMGLNGGQHHQFNDAISLFVSCETQAEIDHFWNALTADGGAEVQCGWLKDKYGVSWQIVPTMLGSAVGHPDPVKAKRAMDAMLSMIKLDIKALQDAVA